jgi:hypothetical protein
MELYHFLIFKNVSYHLPPKPQTAEPFSSLLETANDLKFALRITFPSERKLLLLLQWKKHGKIILLLFE